MIFFSLLTLSSFLSFWFSNRDYDYWTSKFENVVVGGQPIMKCGTVASPCNFFIDPAGGGLSLSTFLILMLIQLAKILICYQVFIFLNF